MFPDENKGQEWSEDTKGPAEIMEEFSSITKKAGTGYITFNRMHHLMLQQLMKTYKDLKVDTVFRNHLTYILRESISILQLSHYSMLILSLVLPCSREREDTMSQL